MTFPTTTPKPVPLPARATKLARSSIAPSTKRVYESALRKLQNWLTEHQAQLDYPTLATYLADLFDQGRSPATCSLIVAALEYQAKISAQASPIGRATKSVLAGISREGKERGRGQSDALTYENVIKVLSTCTRQRTHAKKKESFIGAYRRGIVDKAIVALAFMASLRRSEISALEWRDTTPGEDGNLLIQVRQSKTNQEGKEQDYRLLTGECASALDELREFRETFEWLNETDKVIGLNGQNINRRLQAVCRAAGLWTKKLTSHSGRIGLASELTQRGAEITETALAGGWKSTAMVIHYSRKAQVQRGAVARYF